jgi:glycosyltransferase involved in cell wall biosynthesis
MINVTHINDRFLRNGGAEIFLRELAPRLKGVRIRQSICLRQGNIDEEFTKTFSFPVRFGGRSEIQEAIAAGDILLCWGQVKLNEVLTAKPDICIFNACCEDESQLMNCNRVVTHVIASNSRIKRGMAASWPSTLILPGVNPDRVQVKTHRDVMRSKLGIQPNEFLVGMIARIDHQKRQNWLVECSQQLPPNTKVLFVGDGPDRKKLQSIAPSNCLFTGHQSDGLGDWFNCLDAYCLLSSIEGCPAALYEAMYVGVPVIATPVGSVCDLIRDGENGLIVNTQEALVQAIGKLISNPTLRIGLGQAGQHTAHQFGDIEKTARSWESLINKLDLERRWKPYT